MEEEFAHAYRNRVEFYGDGARLLEYIYIYWPLVSPRHQYKTTQIGWLILALEETQ